MVNIIMEKSTYIERDSSGKEHYRAVMLADTTDELPTREWNGIVLEQGSSITSIGEGAEYMMNSAGAWVRQGGGAPEPTLIEKTITENGEYDPADDDADGYSSVSVNVPTPALTGIGYVSALMATSHFYNNDLFVGYYNNKPTEIIGIWRSPNNPPSNFTILSQYNYRSEPT